MDYSYSDFSEFVKHNSGEFHNWVIVGYEPTTRYEYNDDGEIKKTYSESKPIFEDHSYIKVDDTVLAISDEGEPWHEEDPNQTDII